MPASSPNTQPTPGAVEPGSPSIAAALYSGLKDRLSAILETVGAKLVGRSGGLHRWLVGVGKNSESDLVELIFYLLAFPVFILRLLLFKFINTLQASRMLRLCIECERMGGGKVPAYLDEFKLEFSVFDPAPDLLQKFERTLEATDRHQDFLHLSNQELCERIADLSRDIERLKSAS